jgi:hypothetical protein
MTFLTKRCRLDAPRPGFVVERHNELFYLWGDAIKAGQMASPFEVVHVDAHADLGLGDASYAYVMGELAFEPIEHRYEILKKRRPRSPKEMIDLGNHPLTDGNWLMSRSPAAGSPTSPAPPIPAPRHQTVQGLGT